MASDSVVKCDRQREETRDFHTSHVNVYLAEKRIMEAIINLCLLEYISNFQHYGSIEIRAKIFFFAPGCHGNGKILGFLRH